MSDDKVLCETPTPGKTPTRIPAWKYDLLRTKILDLVGEAGEAGYPFKDLSAAVADRLTEDEKARLGSVGWHVTTVKLDLEVKGALCRMPQITPQRLILGSAPR